MLRIIFCLYLKKITQDATCIINIVQICHRYMNNIFLVDFVDSLFLGSSCRRYQVANYPRFSLVQIAAPLTLIGLQNPHMNTLSNVTADSTSILIFQKEFNSAR